MNWSLLGSWFGRGTRLVQSRRNLELAALLLAAYVAVEAWAMSLGAAFLGHDRRAAILSAVSAVCAILLAMRLDRFIPRPAQALGAAEGAVDQIVRERFFPEQSSGVVVEVGAARPDYLSISALYRSLGWQVIAIDPNPAYAEQYGALGYELLQYACAEQDADDVDFTVVDSHGGEYRGGGVTFESFSSLGVRGDFATLKPDLDASTIKVQVRRLDNILRDHAPEVGKIDLLAVDVEGWELEVLSGLDFDRYRPKVVILENLFFSESYRRFMRSRDYVLWRLITPNEVWVRADRVGALGRLRGGIEAAALTVRYRAGRLFLASRPTSPSGREAA